MHLISFNYTWKSPHWIQVCPFLHMWFWIRCWRTSSSKIHIIFSKRQQKSASTDGPGCVISLRRLWRPASFRCRLSGSGLSGAPFPRRRESFSITPGPRVWKMIFTIFHDRSLREAGQISVMWGARMRKMSEKFAANGRYSFVNCISLGLFLLTLQFHFSVISTRSNTLPERKSFVCCNSRIFHGLPLRAHRIRERERCKIFRSPLAATCDDGTVRPASELEKRKKEEKAF